MDQQETGQILGHQDIFDIVELIKSPDIDNKARDHAIEKLAELALQSIVSDATNNPPKEHLIAETTFDEYIFTDRTTAELEEAVVQLVDERSKIYKEVYILKNCLEAAGAGTWEWNIKTDVENFDEQCATNVGYSLKDLAQNKTTWDKLANEEDLKISHKLLLECIEGKIDRYICELRLKHRDGSEVWVEDKGMVTERDSDGKATKMSGTSINITKRKQLEQELHTREIRFHDLLDNLEAGINVHSFDGSIITTNPKASELLGLTEEQILGRMAIDPNWRFVDEDNFPLAPEKYPVNQVLANKEAIRNHNYGIVHPATNDIVWVSVNGVPILDNQGEVSEVIISFIDITKRKQSELSLKERVKELSCIYSISEIIENSTTDICEKLNRIVSHIPYGMTRPDNVCARILIQDESYQTSNFVETCLKLSSEIIVDGIAVGQIEVFFLNDKEHPYEKLYLDQERELISDICKSLARFIDRNNKEKDLLKLSLYDKLTGLYSRNHLEEQLDIIKNSRQFPVSMYYFDVDNLRDINNKYGHTAGDRLLEKVGKVMRDAFRQKDCVCRAGGDEFVALLPNTDESSAQQTIERVKTSIDKHNQEEPANHLSLSIGFAISHSILDWDSSLKQADDNMYLDKNAKA